MLFSVSALASGLLLGASGSLFTQDYDQSMLMDVDLRVEEPLSLKDSHGRSLDSVDVVNSFLSGFSDLSLELPEVDFGIFTITGPMTCGEFSVGDISVTAGQPNQVTISVDGETKTMDRIPINFQVTELQAECSFPAASFTIPYTGYVSSTGTSINIDIDLFSDEYGYIIPTLGRLQEGASCDTLIDLQISVALGVLDITAFEGVLLEFLYGFLCEPLIPAIENITSIFSENPLVEVLGERPQQPDSLVALVLEKEGSLKSQLPESYTYMDEAEFNLMLEIIREQFVRSPVVDKLITDGGLFVQALLSENDEETLVLLENLMTLFLGENGELPEEIITLLLDTGILQYVIGRLVETIQGEITVGQLIFDLGFYFGIELPSGQDLKDAYMSLPEALLEILDSIGVSEALLGFFSDLQTAAEESTVEARNLQDITGILDLIFNLQEATVGDLIAILGETNAISGFLIPFGEETLLFEVISELFAIVEPVFAIFGDFDRIDIFISEPLPEEVIGVLSGLSYFIPVIADFYSVIEENENTLVGVADALTFGLDVPDMGSLAISFHSLGLDFDAVLGLDNASKVGEGSFLTPLIGLNKVLLDAEVVLKFTDVEDNTYFEGIMGLPLELSFSTQGAGTLALDFSLLQNFGFGAAVDFPSSFTVLSDAINCGSKMLGIAFAGQTTESAFDGAFETPDGTFEGFIQDFVNALFVVYGPGVPTWLESLFLNVFPDLDTAGFVFFGESVSMDVCTRNPLVDFSATPAPVGNPVGGGDGAGLNSGELSSEFIIAIAAVGGVLLLAALFGLFFLAGKKKQGETLEAEEQVVEETEVKEESVVPVKTVIEDSEGGENEGAEEVEKTV